MNRLVDSVVFALLAFSLNVPLAGALTGYTVVPRGTIKSLAGDGALSMSKIGCIVGNLNPAAIALPSYIVPPEEYALIFEPQDVCTACPSGVNIDLVHMVMQTSEAVVLEIAVGVREAAYPNGPSCPEPGAVICTSSVTQVLLTGAGLWDVSLPIDDCPCLDANTEYALSARIVSTSGGTPGYVPDLVLDDVPSNCTSWNDRGSGWDDLVDDAGLPGNLVLFADADCCDLTETSVSDERAPLKLHLDRNTPNPFNPTTTIRFAVTEVAHVTLSIFDLAGRELIILVDEVLAAGRYEHVLDGGGLPSGIYFYRLATGKSEEVRKMTLIR